MGSMSNKVFTLCFLGIILLGGGTTTAQFVNPPGHSNPSNHGKPPGHVNPPGHGKPPGHGNPPNHGNPPPGHGKPPGHGNPPNHGNPPPGQGNPPPGQGKPPNHGNPPPGHGNPPNHGNPPPGNGKPPGHGNPPPGQGNPPNHGNPPPGHGKPPGHGNPPPGHGNPPNHGNHPPGHKPKPKPKVYTFVVTNSTHTRLCNTKTMLTINGTFPGPTIYATRGEQFVVDVYNNASHNITIHWHGVKMPRYPWSDGPEYVTQCPIQPGHKFSQLVILSDEEGTLWWHAHSQWWRSSVYGAIIVKPPNGTLYPFSKQPDGEFPILLGDWWNTEIEAVEHEFLTNGGDPNVSDAFLINGQPGHLYPCPSTFNMTVEYNKTYLIRMINAVMNNIMFFKITNHNITVVGSDGAYTKPLTSDYITISPGQTIDFLLHANQPPSHYYMASRVYASAGKYDNTTTTGIIEYVGNYTPPSSLSLPIFPNFNDTAASFNFTSRLRNLANETDVPLNVTKSLFFTLSVNLRPCVNISCDGSFGERLLASVNNMTMVFPTPRIAILEAYYNNISGVYNADFPDNPIFPFDYTQQNVPRDLWRPQNGTNVNVLEYNSTVEIVFQGTNTVAGIDHPMHLHGYSFYVIGSGFGNFDPNRDPLSYNLVDPPLMETIAVPRNGWTTIRFRANNPGVWFMHCHFERHVSWGMGMVFIVKNGKLQNERMHLPPKHMPPC